MILLHTSSPSYDVAVVNLIDEIKLHKILCSLISLIKIIIEFDMTLHIFTAPKKSKSLTML